MTAAEYLNIGYTFNPGVYKALKESNELCGIKARRVTTFKYLKVDKWKQMILAGDVLGVMSQILNVSIDKILLTKHTDFVYFLKWVESEFIEIVKIEKDLNLEPEDEMIEAGIADMALFGVVNILDGLADGNVLGWDRVGDLPYEKVHIKLLKNKKETIIKRNLAEIRKRNNKSKKA